MSFQFMVMCKSDGNTKPGLINNLHKTLCQEMCKSWQLWWRFY